MNEKFRSIDYPDDLSQKWEVEKSAIYEVADEVVGVEERCRDAPWFNNQC